MATKILPISDLRRQATGIIKTLREEGSVVYVTQHGRPTAVLVDYAAYEAMLTKLEAAEEHAGRARVDAETAGDRTDFLTVAQSINLDGPSDWSENLDEYLYGDKRIDGD